MELRIPDTSSRCLVSNRRRWTGRFSLGAALILAVSPALAADNHPSKPAQSKIESKPHSRVVEPPETLRLDPVQFELRGDRSSLQLVVTGRYAGGRESDLDRDDESTSIQDVSENAADDGEEDVGEHVGGLD